MALIYQTCIQNGIYVWCICDLHRSPRVRYEHGCTSLILAYVPAADDKCDKYDFLMIKQEIINELGPVYTAMVTEGNHKKNFFSYVHFV